MDTEINQPIKKSVLKKIFKWIFSIIFILITVGGFFLYENLNKLLSNALFKSFNSTITSDVYELQFERLHVNLFKGNIRVTNVVFQPRKIPLHNYPYINSTFQLKTKKIIMEHVDLMTLIKNNELKLDRIEIIKPEIEIMIAGIKPILFPFKDTTIDNQKQKSKKKSIDSFFLKKFELTDASIHVINSNKKREFNINKWDISLSNLSLSQALGTDLVSFKQVSLSIGEFTGNLENNAIKQVIFKDLKIKIDSLNYQKSLDTLTFQFKDFYSGVNSLDVQTADSTFHLTMQSFDLYYKDKSINIQHIAFKPNVSKYALQKKFKYQHLQVSGSVGSIILNNLNFDSLIYHRKIIIDEILLDHVIASIFKDKTKPIDLNRFPEYFGQQIKAIPLTIMIKKVMAKNLNLENLERKPDGTYAKVMINRGTIYVENITNLSSGHLLNMNASAYLENKVHFSLKLGFSYKKPEFTMDASIQKFNLTDLNSLLHAYTPAIINKGIIDEIKFSGTAYKTKAEGTLKFLYHDLDINLKLHDQAKWKSSAISFAANSLLASANPASESQPPRIVQFHIDRDMNKAFINVIIKSLLSGLKETMIMSKQNRKDFKESKKKARKENSK